MIIPLNYAQVNLIWGGVYLPFGAQTTFGIVVDGILGDPSADAATIKATVVDHFLENMADGVLLESVDVKYGPNNVGPTGSSASGAAGTIAGTGLSPNVTWLVTKNTAIGGRQGRGRMYIPGLVEGNVDGAGAITGGIVAAFQADLTQFLADMAGDGFDLVLLHSEDSPAEDPYPITSLTVQATAATQRRRLRR